MSDNHIISLIVPLTFVILLVSGSISLNVYAVPPDPGWSKSNTCGAPTTSPWGETKKTCCWTERVPGKLPPNNTEKYCQTCSVNTNVSFDCGDKVLQITGIPGDSRAPSLDGGVLEQPPAPPGFPGGGANIPQEGVLEQPPTGEGSTLPPTGDGLESLLSNEAGTNGLTLQQSQQPANEGLESVLPSDIQNEQEQQSPNEEATLAVGPTSCPPGSVWNPDVNLCLLENPPQLCPDGSLPQSSGSGEVAPSCPPFEAEQTETVDETTTPESDGGQETENANEEDSTIQGQEQPSSDDQISNSTG